MTRRTYTFDLHRGFRFHTGAPVTAQSFADAFNRDAQPDLESPARGFMREIVGARAVIDGKAASISGIRVLSRYRLQIRLTRPVGDFTTRLTMGFFCPILPDTPIARIDDPAGSGPLLRRRANPQSAHRAQTQPVLPGRAPGERRPGRVDDRRQPGGLPACRRAGSDRPLRQYGRRHPPNGVPRSGERYGINRPDGQLFVRPGLSTWYYAFNHDRRAFKGPGQIPLKKAINFAIDRLALTRPAGYLAGKRTDQILPPALARSASIYPLGGPNLAAARRFYARARYKPTTLVLYTSSAPFAVAQARVADVRPQEAGYRPRGEVLRPRGDGPEGGDARRAVRPRPTGLGCRLRRRRQLPRNAPRRQADQRPTDNLNLSYFDDPDTNARIEAANRLTGEARRKAWADLDVELMRTTHPGRRSTTRTTAPSSRRASAASSSTRSTASTSPPPARSRGAGWTQAERGAVATAFRASRSSQ